MTTQKSKGALKRELAERDERIVELEKQVENQVYNLRGHLNFTEERTRDWDRALKVLLDVHEDKDPAHCVDAVIRAVDILTVTWDELLTGDEPPSNDTSRLTTLQQCQDCGLEPQCPPVCPSDEPAGKER